MSVRVLASIALVLALVGCTEDATGPTEAASSSYPPMTLACGPMGTPPVELESAVLERIGEDLRLTWTADDVPPATGTYSASIVSADGQAEYLLSVELLDGDTPSAGTTGPNIVWAEPSRVFTATYPLASMPEIGATFQWSATLAFSDGDGSLSQCPAGGEPVSYP